MQPEPYWNYELVAVKRDWVPEWLFAKCRFLVPIYPFKWLFVRKVK